MSVSLSFSEDKDDKPAAFKPSVDIDLCAESPPKRARQEEVASPPRVQPGARVANAAAQQQHPEEESSGSIDTSKFFVPLSKQGFNVLHRQAAAGNVAHLPPGARAEPPPLTQLKKKGDWGKKKPAAKKAGAKKAADKKPLATKKKTAKKKKDEPEEVDEDEDEEEPEEKKKPEEKRAAAVPAPAARPVNSYFAVPKAAAPVLVDIEPARTAFEHFVLIKQREVDRTEAGASREEKEEIIRSCWESLEGTERMPYDKLAELDQRRFNAELRASTK